jgi:putative oxidoreductase
LKRLREPVATNRRGFRDIPARRHRMALDRTFYDTWTPRAQALLRIVTGYLFLTHGTSKLFGVPHMAMFDNLQILSLFGIAGVLELVGGVLVLVGLWTRPVAFVLSGEMAAAYFMEHANEGHLLVPLLNQGEAAVLYCFTFLFLAAAGAGAWSIDAARARSAARS